VDSLEDASGMVFWRCNIAIYCQRKGREGKELGNGQSGCVDPKGTVLQALSLVRLLHVLGVQAAGLNVLGIIASGNASVAALGLKKQVEHYTAVSGTGGLSGIKLYATPHFKFLNPSAIQNQQVALRLKVPLGNPLAVTTSILLGWCDILTNLQSLRDLEFIYSKCAEDPQSRIIVHSFKNRLERAIDPVEQGKLREELRLSSIKGGTNSQLRWKKFHSELCDADPRFAAIESWKLPFAKRQMVLTAWTSAGYETVLAEVESNQHMLSQEDRKCLSHSMLQCF
jgi:hypothetical protein